MSLASTDLPPLRTLQLGEGWFPDSAGGLNRYFYDLAHHLPDRGVDFRGLVIGDAAIEATSAGRVLPFAPAAAPLWSRCRQARRGMRRALAAGQADAVVAHFALYAMPTLDLLGDRPFVMHFHGPWAEEARVEGERALLCEAKALIERGVYRRAQRLVVLSRAFGELLERRYGVSSERIRVVPGGVDVARFSVGPSRAEARRMLGWPTGRPIALTVRRLARRMGLEQLIDAVEQARRDEPDLLVLIAGRGPLAPALAARITERGLDNHVRLLGFVPDEVLGLAYRAADFCLVPSVALEGFGLIVTEALAAGTPSLVTPVGGLPEVVEALSSALILEGSRPDQLATGMVEALTGRRSLPDAASCRAFAEARYDWRLVADRLRAVYGEAVA